MRLQVRRRRNWRLQVVRQVRQGLLDSFTVLLNLAVFQLEVPKFRHYRKHRLHAMVASLTYEFLLAQQRLYDQASSRSGSSDSGPSTPGGPRGLAAWLQRWGPANGALEEGLLERVATDAEVALSVGITVGSGVEVHDMLGYGRVEARYKLASGDMCQEAWEAVWSHAQLRMTLVGDSLAGT